MPIGPNGDRARNTNQVYSASWTCRLRPEERDRLMRLTEQTGLKKQSFGIRAMKDLLGHGDAAIVEMVRDAEDAVEKECREHQKEAMRIKREHGGFTRLSPVVERLLREGMFPEAKKQHQKETGFTLALMEIRDPGDQMDLGEGA